MSTPRLSEEVGQLWSRSVRRPRLRANNTVLQGHDRRAGSGYGVLFSLTPPHDVAGLVWMWVEQINSPAHDLGGCELSLRSDGARGDGS